MSFRSDIPFIKDARINGMAISLSELMKIVPKGLIQFVTKIVPPLYAVSYTHLTLPTSDLV